MKTVRINYQSNKKIYKYSGKNDKAGYINTVDILEYVRNGFNIVFTSDKEGMTLNRLLISGISQELKEGVPYPTHEIVELVGKFSY